MQIVPYIPAIVCIIGALMFLLIKTNAEAKEIGRLMFWVGLLVWLLGGVKLP